MAQLPTASSDRQKINFPLQFGESFARHLIFVRLTFITVFLSDHSLFRNLNCIQKYGEMRFQPFVMGR
jgi:hypothetical protein